MTSGIIAELSGAKFSQGAIPAMITAAVMSIGDAIERNNTGKGVATENRGRESARHRLTVNVSIEDTLGKMGDMIEASRDYANFFRGIRNVNSLFNDIINISYTVAFKLGLGCGDLMRYTFAFTETRWYGNFVSATYNGNMRGWGPPAFLQGNRFERWEVISNSGCDVRNPYFSRPQLRMGI